MTSVKPDDLLGGTPDALMKTYERLSKVVAEANKGGWHVIDTRFFGARPKDENGEYTMGKTEYLVAQQEYFRFVFVMGVLERATKIKSTTWSRADYYSLVDMMMRDGLFMSGEGKFNETFITKEQLKWINKAYRPEQLLGLSDSSKRLRRG
jgi:hypothetical protein